MREQVFRQGSDHAGADRQALREARLPMNEVLIEARVLYECRPQQRGGYAFAKQPRYLECCAASWEQVEYHYRSGRIAQRLHKNTEAQNAYQAALAVEQAGASYALGNSALQLGLLMEEAGQISEAQHYFKRALQIKNFPFYEGVHQKAKAGLSRLRH
ncbi:MAG: hypothetical protein U5L96_12225 [Owenweeksia sp.]|nr:hypothetical protein [Owenweeksia sp.]